MAYLTKLLERFENEPAYRQRVLDRVLINIGDSMGMFTEDGTLADEDDERVVAARDPRVGGRPLHQYMGLPESSVRSMGVDDSGIATLRQHMEFAPEPDDGDATTRPQYVLAAPAVPAGMPEVDDEGREHPDLQAWAQRQAQDREDLLASREGSRNGGGGPVSIPQTPAPQAPEEAPGDVASPSALPPPTLVPSEGEADAEGEGDGDGEGETGAAETPPTGEAPTAPAGRRRGPTPK